MIKQHIVIVGFMGTGKTTVAQQLGHQLNCLAVDLDDLITQEQGRSANEIIIQDGESSFRELENKMLRSVLREAPALVIAAGGGAWTVAENRRLISEQGAYTVWLDAPFALCWQRIQAGAEARPLAPSRAEAERLYSQRLPVYELADLRVGVADGETAEDIALKIAIEIRQHDAR